MGQAAAKITHAARVRNNSAAGLGIPRLDRPRGTGAEYGLIHKSAEKGESS